MFFEHRPISIHSMTDAGELAEKIADYSWTLCQAFEIGGVLFINDSTCADGIEEYAVVYPDENRRGYGFQNDSITFGRMNAERALEAIVRVLTDANPFRDIKWEKRINEHPAGACHLCA